MNQATTHVNPDDAISQPEVRGPTRSWRLALAWSAIGVSFVLLTLAVVQRLRRTEGIELRWVALAPAVTKSDGAMDDSSRLSELAPHDRASLTVLEPNLAEIGPELDDPKWALNRSRDDVVDTGENVIPPERRWKIYFPPGLNEAQYARQLDALGLELGVLTDDGKIHYVSQVSEANAESRVAPQSAENRVYLTWDRGDLIEADKALLAHAGVVAGDRVVLHFCTSETVEKLTALEREYQKREPAEIDGTVFSVKRTFRGYQVYIIDQKYR